MRGVIMSYVRKPTGCVSVLKPRQPVLTNKIIINKLENISDYEEDTIQPYIDGSGRHPYICSIKACMHRR